MAVLDYEQLIQAVYDAADTPGDLSPVMNDIGRALRAQAGQGFVIPLACPAGTESHHYGGPTSGFEAYERDWRDKDPRFQTAMARPDEVLADTMVLDMKEFERSDVHHEVLTKWGNHYSLFGNYNAGPDLMFAAAWLRSKREGPFGDEEVRCIRGLVPHMTRAVRLRRVVTSLRDQLEDLRRALDTLPLPVAVLDVRGVVTCANGAAEELFSSRDGLRTEKSRLVASVATEQRALEAAIAKAATTADTHVLRGARGRLAPTVTISRAYGTLSIVLFSLRGANAIRERASRTARVLALIHDPTRIARIDRALTAELHGLTPTEADLAAAIAEGRTLAEFAAARGSTEATARTHLKRILDKTQTRRQADLVRLLLTGVALHHLR